jgi:transmembrane sensor
MSNRLDKAAGLGAQLDAGWDAAQAEASLARMHGTRRRRRATRVVVGATLAVAAVVGAMALSLRPAAMPSVPSVAVGPAPIVLHDGSMARPTEIGGVQILEDTAERVTVELHAGAAGFTVTHSPTRKFVVRAGPVSITDLGTEFLLERRADRLRVSVSGGSVRVESPSETVELAEGEARWFSFLPGVKPAAPPAAANDWRALATSGRYDAAYEALPPVGDDVGDLLLAADVARLSGHLPQAVPYLTKITKGHGDDARAPLAAFTLGKLLLDTYRPREAADAFAAVRTLGPNTALAEDALSREIDAWRKAGDLTRAKESTAEYERLYPKRGTSTPAP